MSEPKRCRHCQPLNYGNFLKALNENGQQVWVHEDCHAAYSQSVLATQIKQAEDQLVKMGEHVAELRKIAALAPIKIDERYHPDKGKSMSAKLKDGVEFDYGNPREQIGLVWAKAVATQMDEKLRNVD